MDTYCNYIRTKYIVKRFHVIQIIRKTYVSIIIIITTFFFFYLSNLGSTL